MNVMAKSNHCVLIIILILSLLSPHHLSARVTDKNKDFILNNAENLPINLEPNDLRLYQELFRMVNEKKFQEIKTKINNLENPILVSSILGKIYIHPDYISNFTELADWMKRYPDHALASQVYRLALKKRPNKKYALNRPVSPPLPDDVMFELANVNIEMDSSWDENDDGLIDEKEMAIALAKLEKINEKLQNRENEFAISPLERQVSQIRKLTRRDRLKEALQLARNAATPTNLAKQPELVDRMHAIVISAYYFKKRYQDGFALNQEIVRKLGNKAIESGWWGGLTAWQQQNYTIAHNNFLLATTSRDIFLQSAGWFWAGRSAEKLGNFSQGLEYYQNAANNSTTFYGQLAFAILSPQKKIYNHRDILNQSLPRLNNKNLTRLGQIPVFQRGFSLLAVGQPALAMLEWQPILNKLSRDYAETLLAVAQQHSLPHSSMRLALHLINKYEITYDRALFPIINNDSNLKTDDAALVLAVMRQESHFLPYAISRSGAIGLMQIMPDTARYVSKKDDFTEVTQYFANHKKPSLYDLFQPEINIGLGARYLSYLLNKEDVTGNLILAIGAYNGGLTNMRKWYNEQAKYKADPLLFIESIPVRETRLYIGRVLANYWVYSSLLDSNQDSLRQLASGKFPIKYIISY